MISRDYRQEVAAGNARVLLKTPVFFPFLTLITNCSPVNKEETVEITTASSILIRTVPAHEGCA